MILLGSTTTCSLWHAQSRPDRQPSPTHGLRGRPASDDRHLALARAGVDARNPEEGSLLHFGGEAIGRPNAPTERRTATDVSSTSVAKRFALSSSVARGSCESKRTGDCHADLRVHVPALADEGAERFTMQRSPSRDARCRARSCNHRGSRRRSAWWAGGRLARWAI